MINGETYYSETTQTLNIVCNYLAVTLNFIVLLINLVMILIHLKQPLLRQGFFSITFMQIISETFINFALIVQNFFYLLDKVVDRDPWFSTFPTIFNFFYTLNILYNIRSILYLISLNKNNEETEKDTNTSGLGLSSDVIEEDSISFARHSFTSFHIFSFFFTIVENVLYILKIVRFFNDNDYEPESFLWKWVYYFIGGSSEYYRFAFFTYNYIFFLVSIYYLVLSCNKDKITKNILLKRYSYYCFFSSLVSLLFPIALLIDERKKDDREENGNYSPFIIPLAFLIYLFITCWFRLTCYYVDYILGQNGKGFFNKFLFGLKILFCCAKIPQPNFIDLNSTFVYHALANEKDFSQGFEKENIDNIKELSDAD